MDLLEWTHRIRAEKAPAGYVLLEGSVDAFFNKAVRKAVVGAPAPWNTWVGAVPGRPGLMAGQSAMKLCSLVSVEVRGVWTNRDQVIACSCKRQGERNCCNKPPSCSGNQRTLTCRSVVLVHGIPSPRYSKTSTINTRYNQRRY